MNRVRWPVVVVAACLVVTVAAVAYAAGKVSAPKVLRAQKFELVDAEGVVRASLSMDYVGPSLQLVDASGQRCVELFVIDDPTGQHTSTMGLTFWGWGKRAPMGLRSSRENGTSVWLRDGEGNLRASLGTTDLETTRTGATQKTAESSLVLFDKEGKVMWQAP